jgi:hypothetical protein
MQAPVRDIEVCVDCGDLFPARKEGRCELCYALDFYNWLKETAEEAEQDREQERALERKN